MTFYFDGVFFPNSLFHITHYDLPKLSLYSIRTRTQYKYNVSISSRQFVTSILSIVCFSFKLNWCDIFAQNQICYYIIIVNWRPFHSSRLSIRDRHLFICFLHFEYVFFFSKFVINFVPTHLWTIAKNRRFGVRVQDWLTSVHFSFNFFIFFFFV